MSDKPKIPLPDYTKLTSGSADSRPRNRAPNRYEVEGIRSTDVAQDYRILKVAEDVMAKRRKYNIPDNSAIPDTEIVDRNLETPEAKRELVNKFYVVNPEVGSIPKKVVNEWRNELGLLNSDEQIANFTPDEYSHMINRVENAQQDLVDRQKAEEEKLRKEYEGVKQYNDLNTKLGKAATVIGETPVETPFGQQSPLNFRPKEKTFWDYAVNRNEDVMKDMSIATMHPATVTPENMKSFLQAVPRGLREATFIPFMLRSWQQGLNKIQGAEGIDDTGGLSGIQLGQENFNKPEATDWIRIKSGLRTAGHIILNTIEGLTSTSQETASTLTGREPLIENFLGKKIGDWANDTKKALDQWSEVEDVKRDFAIDFFESLGSMMGFVAINRVIPGGPRTKAIGTAVVGAMANGQSAFEETLKKTKDPYKAAISFWVNAAIGTTEAIPIANMFERLNKMTGGKFIRNLLTQMGVQYFEEQTQEGFQGFTGSVVDQLLTQPDSKLSEIFSQAFKDAEYQAFLGGITGGVTAAVGTTAQTGMNNVRMGKPLTAEEQQKFKEYSEYKSSMYQPTEPNEEIYQDPVPGTDINELGQRLSKAVVEYGESRDEKQREQKRQEIQDLQGEIQRVKTVGNKPTRRQTAEVPETRIMTAEDLDDDFNNRDVNQPMPLEPKGTVKETVGSDVINRNRIKVSQHNLDLAKKTGNNEYLGDEYVDTGFKSIKGQYKKLVKEIGAPKKQIGTATTQETPATTQETSATKQPPTLIKAKKSIKPDGKAYQKTYPEWQNERQKQIEDAVGKSVYDIARQNVIKSGQKPTTDNIENEYDNIVGTYEQYEEEKQNSFKDAREKGEVVIEEPPVEIPPEQQPPTDIPPTATPPGEKPPPQKPKPFYQAKVRNALPRFKDDPTYNTAMDTDGSGPATIKVHRNQDMTFSSSFGFTIPGKGVFVRLWDTENTHKTPQEAFQAALDDILRQVEGAQTPKKPKKGEKPTEEPPQKGEKPTEEPPQKGEKPTETPPWETPELDPETATVEEIAKAVKTGFQKFAKALEVSSDLEALVENNGSYQDLVSSNEQSYDFSSAMSTAEQRRTILNKEHKGIKVRGVTEEQQARKKALEAEIFALDKIIQKYSSLAFEARIEEQEAWREYFAKRLLEITGEVNEDEVENIVQDFNTLLDRAYAEMFWDSSAKDVIDEALGVVKPEAEPKKEDKKPKKEGKKPKPEPEPTPEPEPEPKIPLTDKDGNPPVDGKFNTELDAVSRYKFEETEDGTGDVTILTLELNNGKFIATHGYYFDKESGTVEATSDLAATNKQYDSEDEAILAELLALNIGKAKEEIPQQTKNKLSDYAAKLRIRIKNSGVNVDSFEEKERQQGYRISSTGEKVFRNNSQDVGTPILLGNNTKTKFSRKDSEEGKYAIVKVEDVEPTHGFKGEPNDKNFIREGQPRPRDNDLVSYEEDAKNLDVKTLGPNTIAYHGAPNVNTRLESFQGTGRINRIRLYFFRNNGKDPRGYIDYLKSDAVVAETGITPEQIDDFVAKNGPGIILVRLYNVGDQRAIELGKHKASDLEDADDVLVPISLANLDLNKSAEIKEIGRLLAQTYMADEKITFREVIRKKANMIIDMFVAAGVIDPKNQSKYFQGGAITPAGITNIVEAFKTTLLIGGSPQLPVLWKKVVNTDLEEALLKALPYIYDVPKVASLMPEIQNAILAMAEYKSFKEANPTQPFGAYSSAVSMFTGQAPEDIFTPVELKLAQLFAEYKKSAEIVDFFEQYNTLVNGQDPDFFTNPEGVPVHTREEALKKLGYEKTEQGQRPTKSVVPTPEETQTPEPEPEKTVPRPTQDGNGGQSDVEPKQGQGKEEQATYLGRKIPRIKFDAFDTPESENGGDPYFEPFVTITDGKESKSLGYFIDFYIFQLENGKFVHSSRYRENLTVSEQPVTVRTTKHDGLVKRQRLTPKSKQYNTPEEAMLSAIYYVETAAYGYNQVVLESENYQRFKDEVYDKKPTAEQPKAEQPKAEEPTAEQPKAEQPKDKPDTFKFTSKDVDDTKKDIDDLLKKFNKPGDKLSASLIPGLDNDKLEIATEIVGKFVKLGYYTLRDVTKEILRRGLEQLLPYVKAAYSNFRNRGGYSIAIQNSLDNEDKINSTNLDTIIAEYEERIRQKEEAQRQRDMGGPPDYFTIGGKSFGERPTLRYSDEADLPEVKREFVVREKYGDDLDEHQRYAVNVMMQRYVNGGKAFILGDGPGVGKTREELALAQAYLDHFGKDKKVLFVLISESSKENYINDAKALGIDLNQFEFQMYHNLAKSKIWENQYGLVVFDEAHNLKNDTAKKSIVGRNLKSDHFLYATATPMDKIIHATYFLSTITGQSEDEIAEQLGLELITTTEGSIDGNPYTYAKTLPGVTLNEALTRLMALRNVAVANGAFLRREYPYYGTLSIEEIPPVGNYYEFEAAIVKRAEEKTKALRWLQKQKNWSQSELDAKIRLVNQAKTSALNLVTEREKLRYLADQIIEERKKGRQVIVYLNNINPYTLKWVLEPKFTPGFTANFKGNAIELIEMLEEAGIKQGDIAQIYGGKGKTQAIADFQSGKKPIAIATQKSGGTSVNLDDTVGNAPRTMLIATLDYGGDQTQQTLGRVSRRNTLTPADVRAIFIRGSQVDGRRMQIVNDKLATLAAIQSGAELDLASLEEDLGREGVVDKTKEEEFKKQVEKEIEEDTNPNRHHYAVGKFRVTEDTEKQTVAIKFSGMPSVDVRNVLKANKFRWFPAEKVWWAPITPENIATVIGIVGKPYKESPQNNAGTNLDELDELSQRNSITKKSKPIANLEKEKQRLTKLGITDKWAHFLVATNPGLMNGVNTADELRAKIREELSAITDNLKDYVVSEYSKGVDALIEQTITDLEIMRDGPLREFEKENMRSEAGKKMVLKEKADEQLNEFKAWADYIVNQNDYEEPFKLALMKVVVGQNYNKATDKVTGRTKQTLKSPMPFNPAAIARVHDSFAFDEVLAKEYVNVSQEEAQKELERMTALGKQKTEGRWVKFAGGSANVNTPEFSRSVSMLSGLVQETNWCTKTNARSHLSGGDFYVYVTGKDTPRIAVRMTNDAIAEVSGIEEGQQVEPAMEEITAEFLNSGIKGGKQWLDQIERNKAIRRLDEATIDAEDLTQQQIDDIFLMLTTHDRRYGNARERQVNRKLMTGTKQVVFGKKLGYETDEIWIANIDFDTSFNDILVAILDVLEHELGRKPTDSELTNTIKKVLKANQLPAKNKSSLRKKVEGLFGVEDDYDYEYSTYKRLKEILDQPLHKVIVGDVSMRPLYAKKDKAEKLIAEYQLSKIELIYGGVHYQSDYSTEQVSGRYVEKQLDPIAFPEVKKIKNSLQIGEYTTISNQLISTNEDNLFGSSGNNSLFPKLETAGRVEVSLSGESIKDFVDGGTDRLHINFPSLMSATSIEIYNGGNNRTKEEIEAVSDRILVSMPKLTTVNEGGLQVRHFAVSAPNLVSVDGVLDIYSAGKAQEGHEFPKLKHTGEYRVHKTTTSLYGLETAKDFNVNNGALQDLGKLKHVGSISSELITDVSNIESAGRLNLSNPKFDVNSVRNIKRVTGTILLDKGKLHHFTSLEYLGRLHQNNLDITKGFPASLKEIGTADVNARNPKEQPNGWYNVKKIYELDIVSYDSDVTFEGLTDVTNVHIESWQREMPQIDFGSTLKQLKGHLILKLPESSEVNIQWGALERINGKILIANTESRMKHNDPVPFSERKPIIIPFKNIGTSTTREKLRYAGDKGYARFLTGHGGNWHYNLLPIINSVYPVVFTKLEKSPQQIAKLMFNQNSGLFKDDLLGEGMRKFNSSWNLENLSQGQQSILKALQDYYGGKKLNAVTPIPSPVMPGETVYEIDVEKDLLTDEDRTDYSTERYQLNMIEYELRPDYSERDGQNAYDFGVDPISLGKRWDKESDPGYMPNDSVIAGIIAIAQKRIAKQTQQNIEIEANGREPNPLYGFRIMSNDVSLLNDLEDYAQIQMDPMQGGVLLEPWHIEKIHQALLFQKQQAQIKKQVNYRTPEKGIMGVANTQRMKAAMAQIIKALPGLAGKIKVVDTATMRRESEIGFDEETPNGVVARNGDILLLENSFNEDTMFHEAAHIFISYIKTKFPLLHKALLNSAMEATDLVAEVSAAYPELSGEALQDEIVATALGSATANMFATQSQWQKFKNLVQQFWAKIFNKLGTPQFAKIENPGATTFNQFIEALSKDLLSPTAVAQFEASQVAELAYGKTLKLSTRNTFTRFERDMGVNSETKADFKESDLQDLSTLRTIANNLVRSMEMRVGWQVREGRKIMRRFTKAPGVYFLHSGIVRLGNINDVFILAHELGHKIDYEVFDFQSHVRFANMTNEMAQVLMANGLRDAVKRKKMLDKLRATHGNDFVDSVLHRQELRNEIRDISGYALKSVAQDKWQEPIAEFIRFYVTAPAYAKAKAPKFYALFESIISANPAIENALLSARKQYDEFQKMDSRQQQEMLIERPKERGWLSGIVRNMTTGKLSYNLFDKYKPIELLAQLAKQKDPGMASEDNPYLQVLSLLGVDGRAEKFLENGFDADQEGILKIYNELLSKDILRQFEIYMIQKRNLELHDRGLSNAATMPKDKALEIIANTEAQLGKEYLEGLAQKMYDYNTNLLNWYYHNSGGKLSAKSLEDILKYNQFYIPFKRFFDEETESTGEVNIRKILNDTSPNPIQSIKGSSRSLISPLEQVIKNTYDLTVAAQRNVVLKTLVNALDKVDPSLVQEIPAKVVRRVRVYNRWKKITTVDGEVVENEEQSDMVLAFTPEYKKPENAEVVTVYEDGKAHYYQIPKEFYDQYFVMNEQVSKLIQLVSLPTRWLQAGAVVFDPSFSVFNIPRDQISALVNSRYGYKPFYDMFKGFFSVIKKDDAYRKFMESGADQSFLTSMDQMMSKSYLERRQGKGVTELSTSLKGYWKKYRGNWLLALQDLNRLSELGTRVGAFRNAYKKTGDVYAAMEEARQITGDYGVRGQHMANASRLYAFLNPRLQHLKLTAEVLAGKRGSRGEKLLRLVTWLAIPTLINHVMILWDDDWRELYFELPEWRRVGFWNIPIPGTDTFFPVPKGFYGQFFGTSIEYMLNFMYVEDKSSIPALAEQIFSELSPFASVVDFFPTIGRPVVEQLSNKKSFTGKPIVPKRLEFLDAKEQYTDYTPRIYVWAGELGLSPLRVEALFNGYFGGTAKNVANMTDEMLESFGLVPDNDNSRFRVLGVDLTQMPILRRILTEKSYGTRSQSVESFYSTLDRMEEVNKTVNDFVKSNDVTGAKEYLAKDDNEKLYKYYLNNSPEISKFKVILRTVGEVKSEMKSDPDAIDQINLNVTKLGQDFNSAMQQGKDFNVGKAFDEILKQKKWNDKEKTKELDKFKLDYKELTPEEKKKIEKKKGVQHQTQVDSIFYHFDVKQSDGKTYSYEPTKKEIQQKKVDPNRVLNLLTGPEAIKRLQKKVKDKDITPEQFREMIAARRNAVQGFKNYINENK